MKGRNYIIRSDWESGVTDSKEFEELKVLLEEALNDKSFFQDSKDLGDIDVLNMDFWRHGDLEFMTLRFGNVYTGFEGLMEYISWLSQNAEVEEIKWPFSRTIRNGEELDEQEVSEFFNFLKSEVGWNK